MVLFYQIPCYIAPSARIGSRMPKFLPIYTIQWLILLTRNSYPDRERRTQISLFDTKK